MTCRLPALLAIASLTACQRPPKLEPPKPTDYQSAEGTIVEMRLAPPNPVLSAKAPLSITTSGPAEAAPQAIGFSIDLGKMESPDGLLPREMAKPHQFGSAQTISFSSENIESLSNNELQIQGNWTFQGQSKPASFRAEWSMEGSRMHLRLTPTFRLRDFRPLPKDAPKQTIDPRFQFNIDCMLSPSV